MHLKIRANLNIRERCQIQNIGSSFPLGVHSVTELVQLGRGNPDPYPIPMPLCSSWWLLPLKRYIGSLARCLASLLNLPTGAKMSQQLLWSTQMQTSITHLFHVQQQTPSDHYNFLVSIQGQILISDLPIKSLYAVFGCATGNQNPRLYNNLKIIQLSTTEWFWFCMFSSSNPFFFTVQRISVPGVSSLQKCGFSSTAARNKFYLCFFKKKKNNKM